MQLRIPETVLFAGGKPVKWVGTGPDGRVERRSLDPHSRSARDFDMGGVDALAHGRHSGGQRGGRDRPDDATMAAAARHSVKTIMARVAKVFDEFAAANHFTGEGENKINSSGSSSSSNPLVATVWYLDGQREDMPRKMFRMVTGNPDFLAQVRAVQSYVPAKKTRTGKYETTLNRVAKGRPLGVLEDVHVYGWYALAMSLAHFLSGPTWRAATRGAATPWPAPCRAAT